MKATVNWNYVKNITRTPKTIFPIGGTAGNEELATFTNFTDEAAGGVQVGRSWRATELRLKSNDDLHKLWYVLLKEKNKLLSDKLITIQTQQNWEAHNNLRKVNLSMARLLTVVNERKKLLKEFREHLEKEYIWSQKQEVWKELYGTPNEKGFVESPEKKASKAQKWRLDGKKARADRHLDEIKADLADSSTILTEDDLKLVAQNEARFSESQLVSMHVANKKDLDLKMRRQVAAHIQGQRASHARKIFLKELQALGKQKRSL